MQPGWRFAAERSLRSCGNFLLRGPSNGNHDGRGMCFARCRARRLSAVTPRRRRCALLDKLDFLVRFWELKARNGSLGAPLAPNEQIELLSLMQLVTGD